MYATTDGSRAAHILRLQVQGSFDASPSSRFREVMQSLVRHLHDFVQDTDLTIDEWSTAIDFCTRSGQTCTEDRQELVLLSDVLGLSMLVEILAEERGENAGSTEHTVLGPFHMTVSPPRRLGTTLDVAARVDSELLLVYGRVSDTTGRAVAGASVDVWQADDEGFYDVQRPNEQKPGSGRGVFTTNSTGWFYFGTIAPAPYPIPGDGPVGELLDAAGRSPWRPAHVHFQVNAPGKDELTTHIFLAGSPHLDSDAVFAVRPSLVRTVSGADVAQFVIDVGDLPAPTLPQALRVDLTLSTGVADPGGAP